MGIIQKQTIKGTFYSYLGVIVGFITSVYLRPRALSAEQNGILELLLSYSAIIVQLSSLGFQSASVRYFPYFRNQDKNNHGFLFLSILVSSAGFILCSLIIWIGGPELLGAHNADSIVFEKYRFALMLLSFALLFFGVFDNYNRALYDTVTGTALREFFQKFFVAIATALLMFTTMNFEKFMVIWLAANILPTLIIGLKLARDGNFTLQPDFEFLDKDIVRSMAAISFFAILSGFTTMIIQYIDKIMISKMLGLSQTGIYGITIFFGTVIAMPSRVMYRVAGTIIADKWKENDLSSIKSIYRKSCINQLLLGLLLFVGIWANIDNVFYLLPKEYEAGKYVILFVGLGSLFDMATGVNGVILATSRYFRFDTYFFIALIVVVIAANYLFIPLFGITGAALAAASATLFFNLFRFLFVWIKFGMQPFNIKNLYILLIGVGILFLIKLMPALPNFYFDIFVRSAFITIAYIGLIWYFNLSQEMNEVIEKNVKKYLG
ncbi:lipopolysaccharide biosynthesis protein [Solitalea koreensis]|uniref:Membrane protein involved in the export of O-antigen and teichoic acid n=1 Tax=Solitalea koreensis TaxID=543615 RepID=A0A521CMG8_9SPHI|nr:oligosaccharide flippase family protein [Solitalea koreensis]SMO60626.1 Membrane protein involved in the export of O-antigen and teichoic acid [Solitalea koreensis]